MAYDQQVAERTRTEGFYKHVEWNRHRGVLIKLYTPADDGDQLVTLESGTFDIGYDQNFITHRQFVLSRPDTVRFLLNAGFGVSEIAGIFKQIDGMQVVSKVL